MSKSEICLDNAEVHEYEMTAKGGCRSDAPDYGSSSRRRMAGIQGPLFTICTCYLFVSGLTSTIYSDRNGSETSLLEQRLSLAAHPARPVAALRWHNPFER